MVRVVPDYRGERPRTDAGDNDGLVPYGGDVNALDGPKNMKQVHAMRQAMLLNGVDWWGFAGHDELRAHRRRRGRDRQGDGGDDRG